MRFLHNCLFIKSPSQQGLIDVAIVLTLIPHLFVLELWMLLYVALSLFVILRDKRPPYASVLMFGVGAVMMALSFFDHYHFADLTRMQAFVSLVSSLLIIGISLQRLSGEINGYLRLSPLMLMMLGFFFFDTIEMLVYSLFTLYILVMMMIWARTDAPLGTLLKFTGTLFLLSLPAVVVMFIAFPRISYEQPEYGFRGETYAQSGYSGKMEVSTLPVVPSNQIVMEVFFETPDIRDEQLYFRGSTLETSDGLTWTPSLGISAPERLFDPTQIRRYTITLYPHGQKWIYPLDIPLRAPNKTVLKNDHTLETKEPLLHEERFVVESALSYRLLSSSSRDHLLVDAAVHERTYQSLASLRTLQASPEERARRLMAFFAGRDLSYTTRPTGLRMEDFVDSFLWEGKNGYCVHFASAFALSARMIGIPSRVVTGFKGSIKNKVENYLIVKNADAHAWVELYLGAARGWVRFDPTLTARRNLDTARSEIISTEKSLFETIDLQLMYLKYLIQNWILDYNRFKQMQILEKLLSDTLYLIKFLLALAGIVAVSLLLAALLRTRRCRDRLMCEMAKLLRWLEKQGLEKRHDETMEDFLQRGEETLGVSLESISRLYHVLRYSPQPDPALYAQLRTEITKANKTAVLRSSPSL
ncbi:MAG: DUF3488 domain-containing protein [Campylobacterales bacterium]|nr:DUF3488 domain-containing protein [Campylobacterales bacterium]